MRPSRPFLGRTSYLSGWRQFRGGGGLLEEDFNYWMASHFIFVGFAAMQKLLMKQMQGGQNLIIAAPVLSVGIMIKKKSR